MSVFRGEVVRLDNVWVTYAGSGKPSIKNISFNIPNGSFVLITGPNGAGKTTLIETCLGLLKPIRGSVYLLGINTKSRDLVRVRRRIGYVPQNFMKPPTEHYTVKHVIMMGLAPGRTMGDPVPREKKEDLEYYSKVLELNDMLDSPIGKLSGGQQQKVFIIRSLIRRPQVMFLDEPFSSIDKESRKRILEILRDYVAKYNATIFIVAHQVTDIIRFADQVIEMKDGTIVRIHRGG